MTAAGEFTISGELPVIDGLLDKLKLVSGQKWSVKWNVQRSVPGDLSAASYDDSNYDQQCAQKLRHC